jgi:FMN phosphatase YigB (HAD superfamily)
MTQIGGICFDLFDTLIEVTDKREPFRTLIDNQYNAATVQSLTSPTGALETIAQIKHDLSASNQLSWDTDLAAEIASIRLRPLTKLIWKVLEKADIHIGVCANLALPYTKPIMEILPSRPDSLVLSHQFGFMKPHKRTYELTALQLDLQISQILFVSNDYYEDLPAAAAVGAKAMSTREFEWSFSGWPSIYAPPSIVDLFKRIVVSQRILELR